MTTRHFPDPVKELILARYIRKTAEWLLTAAASLLGITLVFSAQTIQESNVFDALLFLFPLRIWGLIYLILGIFRCSALIVNGYWPHSPTTRYWLSGITLGIVWLPICGSYAIRAILSAFTPYNGSVLPGVIGFPVIAGFELLIMLTMKTWMEILKHEQQAAGTNE